MINLIIFGVGRTAKMIERFLDFNKVSIAAYTDNNERLWGGGVTKKVEIDNQIKEFKIVNPKDILKFNFDYIIIASYDYDVIEKELLQILGVKYKQKILQVVGEKDNISCVFHSITKHNFDEKSEEYEIEKNKIDLGVNHKLPCYQKWYPMYDSIFADIADHLLQDEEGWVIDIGANVGDTIFALIQHMALDILAIEPTKVFFELLKKNINTLPEKEKRKINIVNYYISQYENTPHKSVLNSGTASMVFCNEKDVKHEEAPTITMEKLLKQQKIDISQIKFIKCDTDGYDSECIMSFGENLKDSSAIIYWENYISSNNQYQNYNRMYEYLEQMGYNSYFIFDNYGNYLCEGTRNTLMSVNEYLLRINNYWSEKTFAYMDVLACKEEKKFQVESMIKMHLKKFW